MMLLIKILIFPFYFIMVFPLEFTLWRAYKKNKHIVPSYVRFVWNRME